MKFKIMGTKGDAAFDYDTDAAEVKFNELLAADYIPVQSKGGKSGVVKEFDPDAEKVTWMPKIMGG
jgi:hypothetical protein